MTVPQYIIHCIYTTLPNRPSYILLYNVVTSIIDVICDKTLKYLE